MVNRRVAGAWGKSGPTVLLMVMGLIGLAPAAPAQSAGGGRNGGADLSLEIATADSLSDQQRLEVQSYINDWAGQLTAEQAGRVAAARRRLREPLNLGEVTDAFRNYYSQQLASPLNTALSNDRVIVRLNALIVAHHLTAEAAVPLARQGMGDASEAVRYWAAKILADLARNDALAEDQDSNLLQPLARRLTREKAASVVRQLMLAVANLDVPAARRELLSALNQRVTLHVRNPGQDLRAEFSGLRVLWRQLVAQGENASSATGDVNEQWRQLARASLRYMSLIVRQIRAGNLSTARTQAYADMLQPLASHLREAHDVLNSNQPIPPPIRSAVVNQNWSSASGVIDRWREVLVSPPFNLAQEDLSIPPAEA